MGVLQNILGSNLGQVFKDVVGQFHMSPEDKAKYQAAIDENQKEIQLAQIALEAKAQDTLARETEAASANIRAEAASGDKFTSRARPSFVYVMLGILSANYVVFPLAGKTALVFPDALFWLFGSCMLGYTGARTWEKYSIIGQGK
ncbi:MAG TPA: 3TM-type holin [Candidatus Methylomirabilis sp.]|nr:3TM-type holin [Candidatus Methylomirabilis sp.]